MYGFWIGGTRLADVSERSSSLGRISRCLGQRQVHAVVPPASAGTTRVGPVIALLMIIYALAFVAVANPGAGWVTIVSMLPPSAPMIMPLRVALVNVPAWQLALAVVFLLGGIYGLFRAGARLYQNAVLHSGARLRLREAWRAEPARPRPAQR